MKIMVGGILSAIHHDYFFLNFSCKINNEIPGNKPGNPDIYNDKLMILDFKYHTLFFYKTF